MAMDATALHALPRLALQKLAKENNIKANLKSETIIELLLERQIQNLPSTRKSVSKSPHRSPARPSTGPASLRSPTAKAALKTALASPSRVRQSPNRNVTHPLPVEPASEANDNQQNNLAVESVPNAGGDGDGDESDDSYPDQAPPPRASSAYTFGTPESSLAGSPEPEADPEDLRRTVRDMATIHKSDQHILEQITTLRKAAAFIRSKAEGITKCVRAEKAIRIRMQDYVVHWRRIPAEWTFEEIWSGQLRIPPNPNDIEITTSDEEAEGSEKVASQANTEVTEPRERSSKISPALPPGPATSVQVPPATSSSTHEAAAEAPAATIPAPEEPARVPETLVRGGALEIVMQPAATPKKVTGKRKRDSENVENIDDEERYRPRGRTDQPNASNGEPRPTSSLPRRRLNKGKAKMTPEEVEAMLREQGGKFSMQAAPESETVKNANTLVTYLGLSQAEVEQNHTAEVLYSSLRRAEEAADRAPVESSAPVAELAVPPARVQRRSSRAVSRGLPRN